MCPENGVIIPQNLRRLGKADVGGDADATFFRSLVEAYRGGWDKQAGAQLQVEGLRLKSGLPNVCRRDREPH